MIMHPPNFILVETVPPPPAHTNLVKLMTPSGVGDLKTNCGRLFTTNNRLSNDSDTSIRIWVDPGQKLTSDDTKVVLGPFLNFTWPRFLYALSTIGTT